MYSKSLRFLFKKGRLDTLLFIYEKKEVRHADIVRQNFVRSRSSVSMILRELEDNDLISRHVISTRPPQTRYMLTERGQQVAECIQKIRQLLKRKKV